LYIKLRPRLARRPDGQDPRADGEEQCLQALEAAGRQPHQAAGDAFAPAMRHSPQRRNEPFIGRLAECVRRAPASLNNWEQSMFLQRSFKAILPALAVGALALASASGAASAESAKAFYKGKTVRFIVGYGPGGGYDTYARMLAPYLTKALGANVIVENQPGAGGINALNKVYVAEPDGLEIMIVNGTGATLSQLLEQSGVRYDLSKVGHLGTVSASPWIWIVNKNFEPKTVAGILKSGKIVRWAGAGLTDGLSDGASITCEALKLKCKVVSAYKGSHDAALAVSRGEMDSLYVSDTSANNYVKTGDVVAVASMSPNRSQFFPKLKTIYEEIKLTPEQKTWFDFRSKLDDLGRILITMPKVPKDRLAYLRDAVKKVLTDPAVIAEGQKSQRYIKYVGAEETEKDALSLINEVAPDRKKLIQEVVLRKYH
jgi:tripartite-type tricarboxylate transporter receptor subunit TctC